MARILFLIALALGAREPVVHLSWPKVKAPEPRVEG